MSENTTETAIFILSDSMMKFRGLRLDFTQRQKDKQSQRED